ncbi:hypothetical protein [Listeria monocytogenes]|uniref:hypothetical protein n=1 Tax=Listeria monocytogenes TaxID=1639 RepID=UPI000A9D112D|nr:hypothetical protein [Listeria monocytogenes]
MKKITQEYVKGVKDHNGLTVIKAPIVSEAVANWFERNKEELEYRIDMTYINFCINNALAGKTEVIFDFDNTGFVYFESDRKILKEDFKEITDIDYIKRNLECAIWMKEREDE